jgi:hypothetical protein
LRQLRQHLADWEHAARRPTVGRRLKTHDDALRVNAKKNEAGAPHPERDAQFQDIEMQPAAFTAAGCPIISVDTKTKERVSDFKNAGQIGCQHPLAVTVHDFPGDALERAVPNEINQPTARLTLR